MAYKVKFTSRTFISDYVEETEDGQLITHPRYLLEEKDLVGEVVSETKYNYRLKLENGDIIKKHKKHCVKL